MATETTALLKTDLEAQREYVRKTLASKFDFGIVVGDAFVRGIRDIGYKSTGTALDELIDNAIQAGAQSVHVAFGLEGASNKPARLAIMDDGHGMDPEMIRLAVIWGGTHREDDRRGFGRYGYGLPSACVSQGKRYTVYSVTEGGEWHAVTIDLVAISKGELTDSDGRIVVPEAKPTKLPDWVAADVTKLYGKKGLRHGTIIVIDKLDRLSWKTQSHLKRNLLEHFGVVYRNYLRATNIFVEGQSVAATDPLFTTPGLRYYELPGDKDKAEALDDIPIEVKDVETGESKGTVRVRFSYMPPTFMSSEKDKDLRGAKKNPRMSVRKDHNGIIVLRNGRQIDVIEARCPWTTFQNNDMTWGCEIDFPATLDEEFAITTSKQQVVLSERMWDLLAEAGVYRTIKALRTRSQQERDALKHKREATEDEKRASEQAMEEAQKFLRRTEVVTPEREAKTTARVEEEVRRRAEAAGVESVQIEHQIMAELKERPYKLETTSAPSAPFFWVDQIGSQTKLFLNTAHRFYGDVYAGPESTPRLRAAIEVVLFVIGQCELDSTDERQLFYQNERVEWSRRLDVVLNRLETIDSAEEEDQPMESEETSPEPAGT